MDETEWQLNEGQTQREQQSARKSEPETKMNNTYLIIVGVHTVFEPLVDAVDIGALATFTVVGVAVVASTPWSTQFHVRTL